MSCDDTWFSHLRGLEVPEPLDPAQYADRQSIRAQVLRFLNDMGIKTRYQDYIFYIYEHP